MASTMKDQVVLVLGGSSGMGLATAKAAAAAGARVVITGRKSDSLQLATRELGEFAQGRTLDATVPEQLTAFLEEFASIDHIYSTIGDYVDDRALQADMGEVERAMNSRYLSGVVIARVAAPRIRSGGSIILTGGIASWKPMGSVASAASCAAIESMVQTLAIALAPVRVNCISPGFIRTGLNAGTPQEAVERLSARIPMKRPGRPEEIAEAAMFLMRNEYVTGTTVVVDGGLRLT